MKLVREVPRRIARPGPGLLLGVGGLGVASFALVTLLGVEKRRSATPRAVPDDVQSNR